MKRRALTRGAALLVAASFVVASSCDVSYTDCAVACAANGDCPSELRCSNGFCSSGPVCEGRDGTGGAGEPGASGEAGNAGSAGDATTGGTAPTGGRAAPGGEGGSGTSHGGENPGGAGSGGRSTGGSAGMGTSGDGGAEPWTPRELAGLSLWLDAEAEVETTFASSGSRVRAWRDQSGFQNDALQSNPDLQPRLSATVANGHPAVRFIWPITFMTMEDAPTLRAGYGNFTVQIVTAWLNSTVPSPTYSGYGLLFLKQLTYPYTGIAILGNDGRTLESRLWFSAEAEIGVASSHYNLNDNTFRLCGVRRVGASRATAGELEIRVNGALSTRDPLPRPLDLSGIGEPVFVGGQRNGNEQALNGFIAEIVFVIGDLSDGDLAQLERYLNEKYSLWRP